MRIGPWEVIAVETGEMRLDGGAMFGSVPKVLWQREHAADAGNRIRLALRCLVLRGEGRCVLVDTGAGDKWSARELDRFGIRQPDDPLRHALAAAGVEPADVTDVVLTHLHFDHAGGATRRGGDGNVVPTLPHARHWVQRANLDHARRPGRRERASYRADDFEPLTRADLRLVDGDAELFDGVRVQVSDGHTRGLQIVSVEEGGEGLVYPADLVPTVSHLRAAYTMGYDIHPGLLVEEKAKLLGSRADRGHLIFFEHDPRVALGSLIREKDEIALGRAVTT